MNDIQENKLTMYQAVQDFLDDHAAALVPVPNIATAKTELDGLVTGIMEAEGIAVEDTTGSAEAKAEDRQNLVTATLKVARGMKAKALDDNNRLLLRKVDVNKSQLNKMRDSALYVRGKTLYDLATPIIVDLAPYLVTPAEHAELDGALTAFIDILPEPNDLIEEKVVAGEKVDRLMDETDELLLKVDSYLDLFEFTEPDLWAEYQLAREIDDHSGPSGGGGTDDNPEEPGSGETGATYSGGVPMMSNTLVASISYDGTTPVRLENTGSTMLNFYLQQTGMPVGGGISLMPSEIQNITLADIGPSGNELWVSNNHPDTNGSYEVVIG